MRFAPLAAFALTVSLMIACSQHALAQEEPPRSLDSKYQLVEFATWPDIVTPTGMTVDAKNRVWAIESHTHFRPENYDGPKADRIKVFEDTNGDGKSDKYTIFHEGGKATMGIGIHPNKCIVVAERSKITRYWDADDDLKPEKQETLVTLETKGDYPHNGLSGFAFDMFGNIYFGLGENLGEPYKVLCKDGSKYEGGGEGGSIFRCSETGGELKMIATGFWNPFHLCFNQEGSLFAVDNDPDSRPPCRLLQILEGGDYGYRFRNGRKGLHPFTAWNGELPGTLPMLAGTGEAPSGVLLDITQRDSLLVTSWGDHRIERYTLEKRSGSYNTYNAKKSIVVQGGENFRPVGIGQDSKGHTYFTDWVLKDYNLHKKGRIWSLRNVGVTRISGHGFGSAVLEWVGERNPKLDSADPYERHGAQMQIEKIGDGIKATKLEEVASPLERSEWAVAMRRNTPKDADRRIPQLLADADWRVRFVGIEWIGEEKLKQHEGLLRENLQKHSARREEMEATLVALRMLAGEETKSQDEQGADSIVLKMVLNEELPAYTRARSLRYLRPDHPKLTLGVLQSYLDSKDEDLQLEAIRTLRERAEVDATKLLASTAEKETNKSELRAEATAGLGATAAAALLQLSQSTDAAVATEAKRKLRKQEAIEPWSGETVLQELQEDKAAQGDPARGSRFFFTSEHKSSPCHTYDGRGPNVGPDLTRIAENRDAAKIADSILHPSKEIAPQFAVMQLELTSGVVKSGVYIGATPEGKERFVDAEAKIFELDSAEVASRHSVKTSLMPEDISKRMTKEEFLDLVAFLGKRN